MKRKLVAIIMLFELWSYMTLIIMKILHKSIIKHPDIQMDISQVDILLKKYVLPKLLQLLCIIKDNKLIKIKKHISNKDLCCICFIVKFENVLDCTILLFPTW